MSNIELVIDIPEGILNTIQADNMISREQLAVLQMHILNGTPLPKGHGKLKDADTLWDAYHANGYDFYEALDDTPTIIEADKAESEG